MLGKRTIAIVSIVTGIALELGIHALSGRREAWDSSEFWTLGMPIALLVSLLLGFLSRSGNWLWTALVVPAQVMTMMVRGGEIGNLWPLTVALSSILSAPFVFVAFIGSRFRKDTPASR